ncbi:hypothetical protein [Thioalkalivibrio sp. ALJ24]|uniref:hypothetical protein n=1 Tax=Thioalkalivibrio sp. ALJ24 TaxID=545276 RepID=UPI00035FD9A1|nr:hypothetical protein [Thioalkalivibrio sp. ALJ24]
MSEVRILVPGLRDALVAARAATGGGLALRLLRQLLARSQPGPAPEGTASDRPSGWEPVLAQALGYRPPAPDAAASARTWLASPVALNAGMQDLTAQPVDGIDDADREALWAAAEPELEAHGARLERSPQGLWLLTMTAAGPDGTASPSAGWGRPMPASSLDSEAARSLQVLGNAIQMAWFDHPVNQRRAEHGQAPVQGLWFWSPGEAPATAPALRVAGGGIHGRWLAESAGAQWEPDPAAGGDVIVMDALQGPATPERMLELLTSLVLEVMAPRAAGLRFGRMRRLEIEDPLLPPSEAPRRVLRGRDTWALWRRRAPWPGL